MILLVYQIFEKENQENFKDLDEYRSFVGRQLFMAQKADPFSLHAVRNLSAYLSNPTDLHWKSPLHLAGYLKGHYRAFAITRNINTSS
jgi:hypothetical protein